MLAIVEFLLFRLLSTLSLVSTLFLSLPRGFSFFLLLESNLLTFSFLLKTCLFDTSGTVSLETRKRFIGQLISRHVGIEIDFNLLKSRVVYYV